MTKAKIAARRKEASSVIKKWKPRLFLHEWYIDLHYPKEDIDSGVVNSVVMADVETNPVYMTALIRVFPSWMNDSCSKKRELALVHELAHCLTDSLYNCGLNLLNGTLVLADELNSEREQLTQRIANIAFKDEWD
jgi:hypothetical protein